MRQNNENLDRTYGSGVCVIPLLGYRTEIAIERFSGDGMLTIAGLAVLPLDQLVDAQFNGYKIDKSQIERRYNYAVLTFLGNKVNGGIQYMMEPNNNYSLYISDSTTCAHAIVTVFVNQRRPKNNLVYIIHAHSESDTKRSIVIEDYTRMPKYISKLYQLRRIIGM